MDVIDQLLTMAVYQLRPALASHPMPQGLLYCKDFYSTHVAYGSRCEELNLSKFRPPCPTKRTLAKRCTPSSMADGRLRLSSNPASEVHQPTRTQTPFAADDLTAASMNFMPASPSCTVG